MILVDAVSLFQQTDWLTLMALVWHLVIFEAPRYLLASVAIAFVHISTGRQRGPPSPPSDLRISVLLPGHNEAHNLRRSVLSIREQTAPPCQIVIVDDGSTDDMGTIAENLRAEGLVNIVLKTERRGGKSAAANLGLRACIGDIVVIADADTTYDRDAFEMIAREFSNPSVGAVAGNLGVRNINVSMATRLQTIEYLISISLGRRISDMFGILYIVSGAFGAFRREALIGVGGWDVGPGEDADITMKVRRAGWRVRFAPQAWGLTDVPETPAALVRQRLRWNRSVVRIRLRKFKSILNPWSAQFSVLDAVGLLDVLFFQVVVASSFAVYLVWLFVEYADLAPVILALTSMVYVVAGMMSFIMANAVTERRAILALMPEAAIYGLYNSYFQRFVRLYAYADELVFRRSYSDDYVPERVRRQAEKF